MIGTQIGLCSLLGTPWLVASTVPAVNHVRSLTRESESVAPGERPKFLGVRLVCSVAFALQRFLKLLKLSFMLCNFFYLYFREQRVTGVVVFIFVGLSAFMASVLEVKILTFWAEWLCFNVSTLLMLVV